MKMHSRGRPRRARWIARGAAFGIVAGAVFAMFEMVVAWAMGDGFFMPLRMIGAIVLGERALEPSYGLATAAVVGAIVHMMLSAAFGAVFGAIASVAAPVRRSVLALLVAASVYGVALWLVNFYVIAPVAFPWFSDADQLVQFVAHTFFFGTVLGVLFAAGSPAHAADAERRYASGAAEEPLAAEREERARAAQTTAVRSRDRV